MDQMDHVKEDLFGFFIGKCLNVFLLFIVVLIFLIMSKHAAGEFFFRQQHSNNFDDALTTIYSPLCCFCRMTHQF